MTNDEWVIEQVRQVVEAVEAWWQEQGGATREQLVDRLVTEAGNRSTTRHEAEWILAEIAAAGMVVQRESGE